MGQAGYQSDADTGLMLLGHRLYDSSTGRFISRDPVQDGDNWYAYVGNDPVNRIDPKGLDGEGLEFEEMLVKAIAENDPDQVGTLIESITDTDTADAVEGAMKQAKLPKKRTLPRRRLPTLERQSKISLNMQRMFKAIPHNMARVLTISRS